MILCDKFKNIIWYRFTNRWIFVIIESTNRKGVIFMKNLYMIINKLNTIHITPTKTY